MSKNRFEKIHLIAQGVSGKVHKAFDNDSKKIVALKSFPDFLNDSVSITESIQNEFGILKDLHSEYFVEVHEIAQDSKNLSQIVLEFIDGSPLKVAFNLDKALETKQVFVQILNALVELEKVGIIHGDLKSDNILIQNHKVKIIDFGFAQTLGGRIDSNSVSGTLEYTAPEKFTGENISSKVDIYSIGVLFYEILTGTNPFADSSVEAIIEKHLNLTPKQMTEINSEIDSFWENVIFEMLEKEPASRPKAEEILQKYFQDVKLESVGNLVKQFEKIEDVFEKREKLLELFEQVKNDENSEGFANVTFNLSKVYQKLGNYENAIEFAKKALKVSDEKTKIELLCLIGVCFWALEKLENSNDYLLLARKTSVESTQNKSYFLGLIEKNLGNLYCKFLDFNKAFEHYNTALAIFINEKNTVERYNVLGNLGRLCSEIFDFEKALSYLNQIKDYFEKIEDLRQLSTTLLNIAVINTQLLKLGNAKNTLEYALQLHQKHGFREESTRDWLILGYVCGEIGEFGVAIKYLQNALEEYKELDDQAGIQTAKLYLSQVFQKIGDFEASSEIALSETEFFRKDLELEFLQEEIKFSDIFNLEKVEKGISEAQSANFKNLEIDFKILRSEHFFQIEEFETAKESLHELIKETLRISYISGMIRASFLLCRILESEELWNEAYKVLERVIKIVTKEEYFFTDMLFYHFGKIQKKIFYPDADYYLIESGKEFERVNSLIHAQNRKEIHRESRREIFKIEEIISGPKNEKRREFRRTEDEYYYHFGLLMEINKSINSELDPKRVMKLIMEKAILITDADKGFIMIRNAETNELEFVESYGFEDEILSLKKGSALSTTITLDVYKTGQAYLKNHVIGTDNFIQGQSIKRLQIQSILCVPLKNKRSEVFGVLYVHSQTMGKKVSEVKKNILVAMADQVSIAIENSRDYQNLKEEVELLKTESKFTAFGNLIGQSPKMKKIFYIIDKVSKGDSNIFINGESGTGKEVVARVLHQKGDRKDKPFIAVDCGALPENLLESELFGHKKGAFTGAYEERKGVFEEAEGGVIFLDEITNTTLAFQARLLRVLQEREVRRLGENTPRKVNVRVIAATNRNVKEMVKNGEFREDLFYRLFVVPIEIPPLRERVEDIPLLVQHFLTKFNTSNGTQKTITKEAVTELQTFQWNGNVRQLENIVEQMAIFSEEKITTKDLPELIRGTKTRVEAESFAEDGNLITLAEAQRRHISFALSKAEGKMTLAAKLLGVNRSTLYKKMEILGLR
ncbi:MAG: GAF domain-containing protein [Calditrichaeota bacterium]|nr:MAG: GAF domain-containing protein [Calditrichota bacterium]